MNIICERKSNVARTFDGILIEEDKMNNAQRDYLIHWDHAIQDLLQDISANYCRWSESIKTRNGDDSDYRDEQAREFGASLSWEVGRKFIKIFTDDRKNSYKSVWGFIVKENDSVKCTTSEAYFSKGDLLKASSWKQAERNMSRGNVLNGQNAKKINGPMQPDYPNYKTTWSGVS